MPLKIFLPKEGKSVTSVTVVSWLETPLHHDPSNFSGLSTFYGMDSWGPDIRMDRYQAGPFFVVFFWLSFVYLYTPHGQDYYFLSIRSQ